MGSFPTFGASILVRSQFLRLSKPGVAGIRNVDAHIEEGSPPQTGREGQIVPGISAPGLILQL